MCVPDRNPLRRDGAGLLKGEELTLAGGGVGAVVETGARDEEARVGLDVDARTNLTMADVVEVFWQIRREGIDTLCVCVYKGDRVSVLCVCM